jgi:hypothetical protein
VLDVRDMPVCIQCAELSPEKLAVRTRLFRDLHEAVSLAELANDNFMAATNSMPPHPDGTLQIHKASHQLTAARGKMLRAHNRLNDFLERGIVPDDLKQSG